MISGSALETRNIGNRLAGQLRAGDVVLLSGDLGAGKSEFARGIARGLGITDAVPSPSFTILNVYTQGRVPLYHFDWYRINTPEELSEMGAEEQIGTDGIALIEWSENAPEYIPEKHLTVEIKVIDENTREINIIPYGGFSVEEDLL